MNTRQRFLNTFSYKEVDRVPDLEFGYWDETIERWHNEGLPKNVTNISQVEKHLGIEQILSVPNPYLDINITEKKIADIYRVSTTGFLPMFPLTITGTTSIRSGSSLGKRKSHGRTRTDTDWHGRTQTNTGKSKKLFLRMFRSCPCQSVFVRVPLFVGTVISFDFPLEKER